VDQPPQSLRLGADPGDRGLRHHRISRRLEEAPHPEGHLGQGEVRSADRSGRLTHGVALPLAARRLHHGALDPLFQGGWCRSTGSGCPSRCW
jgi:hypothetical protein